MNAYKNKIAAPSAVEMCVVDVPQLNTWYRGVLEGQDLRDRMAVSGFSISRGAFGSLSTVPDATEYAEAADSAE